MFRAFCALADGAASVLQSSLKHFREEFEEHVRIGGCPFRVEHEVAFEHPAGARETGRGSNLSI